MATSTQSPALAQATLTALSGQNYSSFSSTMVQGAQLFMNNFANQTGGGASPVSNRVALAEACDVACDGTLPPQWGAWGGALGGLGTIGASAGPAWTTAVARVSAPAPATQRAAPSFKEPIRLRRFRWRRPARNRPGRASWPPG